MSLMNRDQRNTARITRSAVIIEKLSRSNRTTDSVTALASRIFNNDSTVVAEYFNSIVDSIIQIYEGQDIFIRLMNKWILHYNLQPEAKSFTKAMETRMYACVYVDSNCATGLIHNLARTSTIRRSAEGIRKPSDGGNKGFFMYNWYKFIEVLSSLLMDQELLGNIQTLIQLPRAIIQPLVLSENENASIYLRDNILSQNSPYRKIFIDRQKDKEILKEILQSLYYSEISVVENLFKEMQSIQNQTIVSSTFATLPNANNKQQSQCQSPNLTSNTTGNDANDNILSPNQCDGNISPLTPASYCPTPRSSNGEIMDYDGYLSSDDGGTTIAISQDDEYMFRPLYFDSVDQNTGAPNNCNDGGTATLGANPNGMADVMDTLVDSVRPESPHIWIRGLGEGVNLGDPLYLSEHTQNCSYCAEDSNLQQRIKKMTSSNVTFAIYIYFLIRLPGAHCKKMKTDEDIGASSVMHRLFSLMIEMIRGSNGPHFDRMFDYIESMVTDIIKELQTIAEEVRAFLKHPCMKNNLMSSLIDGCADVERFQRIYDDLETLILRRLIRGNVDWTYVSTGEERLSDHICRLFQNFQAQELGPLIHWLDDISPGGILKPDVEMILYHRGLTDYSENGQWFCSKRSTVSEYGSASLPNGTCSLDSVAKMHEDMEKTISILDEFWNVIRVTPSGDSVSYNQLRLTLEHFAAIYPGIFTVKKPILPGHQQTNGTQPPIGSSTRKLPLFFVGSDHLGSYIIIDRYTGYIMQRLMLSMTLTSSKFHKTLPASPILLRYYCTECVFPGEISKVVRSHARANIEDIGLHSIIQILAFWLHIRARAKNGDDREQILGKSWKYIPSYEEDLFKSMKFLHRLLDQLDKGGREKCGIYTDGCTPTDTQTDTQTDTTQSGSRASTGLVIKYYTYKDIRCINAVRAYLEIKKPRTVNVALLQKYYQVLEIQNNAGAARYTESLIVCRALILTCPSGLNENMFTENKSMPMDTYNDNISPVDPESTFNKSRKAGCPSIASATITNNTNNRKRKINSDDSTIAENRVPKTSRVSHSGKYNDSKMRCSTKYTPTLIHNISKLVQEQSLDFPLDLLRQCTLLATEDSLKFSSIINWLLYQPIMEGSIPVDLAYEILCDMGLDDSLDDITFNTPLYNGRKGYKELHEYYENYNQCFVLPYCGNRYYRTYEQIRCGSEPIQSLFDFLMGIEWRVSVGAQSKFEDPAWSSIVPDNLLTTHTHATNTNNIYTTTTTTNNCQNHNQNLAQNQNTRKCDSDIQNSTSVHEKFTYNHKQDHELPVHYMLPIACNITTTGTAGESPMFKYIRENRIADDKRYYRNFIFIECSLSILTLRNNITLSGRMIDQLIQKNTDKNAHASNPNQKKQQKGEKIKTTKRRTKLQPTESPKLSPLSTTKHSRQSFAIYRADYKNKIRLVTEIVLNPFVRMMYSLLDRNTNDKQQQIGYEQGLLMGRILDIILSYGRRISIQYHSQDEFKNLTAKYYYRRKRECNGSRASIHHTPFQVYLERHHPHLCVGRLSEVNRIGSNSFGAAIEYRNLHNLTGTDMGEDSPIHLDNPAHTTIGATHIDTTTTTAAVSPGNNILINLRHSSPDLSKFMEHIEARLEKVFPQAKNVFQKIYMHATTPLTEDCPLHSKPFDNDTTSVQYKQKLLPKKIIPYSATLNIINEYASFLAHLQAGLHSNDIKR